MVQLLGLPAGGRVLEVGCGRGIALPPIAHSLHPDLLVGLDVDGRLLDLAAAHLRERGVSASLYCGDVRTLPFADAHFDLVVDFGTCHHISSPDRALSEIVRVLRPGGLFVCETVTSQLLSHPFRSRGRRLPWEAAPELRVVRDRFLWKARMRLAAASPLDRTNPQR